MRRLCRACGVRDASGHAQLCSQCRPLLRALVLRRGRSLRVGSRSTRLPRGGSWAVALRVLRRLGSALVFCAVCVVSSAAPSWAEESPSPSPTPTVTVTETATATPSPAGSDGPVTSGEFDTHMDSLVFAAGGLLMLGIASGLWLWSRPPTYGVGR